jgi:hypothetical protein
MANSRTPSITAAIFILCAGFSSCHKVRSISGDEIDVAPDRVEAEVVGDTVVDLADAWHDFTEVDLAFPDAEVLVEDWAGDVECDLQVEVENDVQVEVESVEVTDDVLMCDGLMDDCLAEAHPELIPGQCERLAWSDEECACVLVIEPVATLCDDGLDCTLGDHCQQDGACAGTPVHERCGDGDPCTEDHCVVTVGCEHEATPLGDDCVDGEVCPDGWICVDEVCGLACGDGDVCTWVDVCDGLGQCQGMPVDCSDGNPCTDDGCGPLMGCVYTANWAICDDGNSCTGGDQCTDGACQSQPFLDGTPCSDGDLCTEDDVCLSGVCVGVFNNPGQGILCESSEDPCVSTNCDMMLFVCVEEDHSGCCEDGLLSPDGTSCNDYDICTEDDVCQAGICAGVFVTSPSLCECWGAWECDDCLGYDQNGTCVPNLCTYDFCVDNLCTFEWNPYPPAGTDCCQYDIECDEGDPSKVYWCKDYVCQEEDNILYCNLDEGVPCAASDNACLISSCDMGTFTCIETVLDDCCVDDNDCDDDVCSAYTCSDLTHTCVQEEIEGCCLVDADCDDDDACTQDDCHEASNTCYHIGAEFPYVPEICNGLDDDCDGLTDAEDAEDLLVDDPAVCDGAEGVCEGAVRPAVYCQGGGWSPCDEALFLDYSEAFEPEPELTLDGLDNDCDGQTDEGL